MLNTILSILLQGVVVLVTSKLVPGFVVRSYGTAIGVAIVYGVLSWLLKTLLVVLTFPFILLTFGLFLLVLNAFLLWLTDKLMDSIEIKGTGTLFISAFLITIGQWIVDKLMS